MATALSAGLAGGVAVGQSGSDELDRRLHAEIRPILEASCVGCHGETEAWAGLRLDGLESVEAALGLRHELALAAERVERREMPPAGQPEPTEAERRALLEWLGELRRLGAGAPAAPVDPGWYTVRRLNTDEYRLTMRDL
ncbi:MAG: c-type cytochrome domain-containing protein, partial [Phycisphaerales bacterium]